MTEALQIICVTSLIFILTVMVFMLKPEKEEPNETQNINSVDALTDLLNKGIITQQEYNKLIVKVMNK